MASRRIALAHTDLHRIAAWSGLLAVLAGCGHPATAGECDEIFRRSAELELKAQNVSNPEEISRRVEEARVARGEELTRECVGNRITDAAMECVRGAQTAEELDGCLK